MQVPSGQASQPCMHIHTYMNAQMHTVLVFLTNRDAFVLDPTMTVSAHVPSIPTYLPTYVECSCLRECWLPHQGGPHLPHSVRHTLICVWRHRRAWGEAPVHAHTYVRTYLLTVCGVHLSCVAEVLYNGLY